MKRIAAMMVAVVLCAGIMTGCGSSSGDDAGGSVQLSLATLAGNYILTGFSGILSTGQTVTQDDANSWSGSMTVRSDSSWSQTTEIDGARAVSGGTLEVLNASAIRVYQTSPAVQTYDMSVMFDGQTFMGSVSQDGNTVTKTWRKQ